MNLADTIIPRSDQKNADDLLTGPQVIKITAVEKGSVEQPVVIRYEGDSGRPYKPGKSMRRVMVAMWGAEGAAYVGKRLKLYAEPTVKFGGKAVGGIRISHADIPEAFEMMLTETRGQKKPFRVEPLPHERNERAAPTVASSASVALTPADLAPYEITGREQAEAGNESLAAWWKSVPTAVKLALKPKLDAEWKPIAAKASGSSAT